ncbi:DOPA 4,5-dioxygenase family protein [Vibrio sp. TRT 21S02]|uniref:DOPA 4,5-dioxygenase family protein n=1 Tax=Vibrio sp. TRT 21S02 TaxID=3418507 RepID=UPI003CEFCC99
MFHAHVYFALKDMDQAQALHDKIKAERKDVLAQFPLVPRLVGPHKMPMFELHFANNQHQLIEWLDAQRGTMSVLIHPVSEEHLLDHTERAVWLGRELGVLEETL